MSSQTSATPWHGASRSTRNVRARVWSYIDRPCFRSWINTRLRINQLVNGRRYLAGLSLQPNSSAFRVALSRGAGLYQGVSVGLNRRMANHLDLSASYTLSSATSIIGTSADDTDANLVQDVRDPFGAVQDAPLARSDARHRVSISAIVEAPFGINVAPIFLYQSALPTHSLQGAPVTVASLHGHPAIVHFWASWCGPCTKEAPELARLSGELKGRATLVGVDWSDNSGNARKFLARHHWTFASLSDPNGASGNAYGISGLPTTFILDAKGRIVKRLTGPQTAAGLLAEVQQV